LAFFASARRAASSSRKLAKELPKSTAKLVPSGKPEKLLIATVAMPMRAP